MAKELRRTTMKGFLSFLQQSNALNVITSVTRGCVLKCRYCYAIDPRLKGFTILSDELLQKIIKDAFGTRRKSLVFEWTGGEALLAGKEFYQKVLDYQQMHKRNGIKFENVIQTSGGLYDEKLYDFLVKNAFTISLTIDGPPDLHNSHRPLRNGGPSFDRVLKSFRYLQKVQGKCGAIVTITKNSIGREREMFDFFKSIGLKSWHSNLYIYDPNKPNKDDKVATTEDDYYNYYNNQLRAYLETDDTKLNISDVRYFLKALCGIRTSTLCSHGGRCLTNFINIDPEGNAAICPKFLGYPEHRLGNVDKNSIAKLISPENPKMKKYISERLQAVQMCEEEGCKYIPICRSGCPYMSLLGTGNGKITGRDIMCGARKKVLESYDSVLTSYGVKTYPQFINEKERRVQ